MDRRITNHQSTAPLMRPIPEPPAPPAPQTPPAAATPAAGGDRLKVKGTGPLPDLPTEDFHGAAVAFAAQGVVQGGYSYDHGQPGDHNGVCADFAAMAIDHANGQPTGALEARMNDWFKQQGTYDLNTPHNARNVIGQVEYWQAHPQEAQVVDTHGTTDPKGPTGVKVGDLVYFGEPPTHVAVVTGVDDQGHPTRIAHAHGKTADSSDQEDHGTAASDNEFGYQGPEYTEFHDPAKITTVVRPNPA